MTLVKIQLGKKKKKKITNHVHLSWKTKKLTKSLLSAEKIKCYPLF